MMQAMRAAGRAPLVRVPWNDAVSIMRALDVGASTVVVPMVDTAEDAFSARVNLPVPAVERLPMPAPGGCPAVHPPAG